MTGLSTGLGGASFFLLLLLLIGPLTGCGESDRPDDKTRATQAHEEAARMVSAQEAIAGSHLPTLDPATMNEAEIRRSVDTSSRCEFRYTAAGKPVLAAGLQPDGSVQGGMLKLNGNLVTLQPAPVGQSGDGLHLQADPVRVVVAPDGGGQQPVRERFQRREANMVFEVGEKLKVGYRGYWDCGTADKKSADKK